jgi:soluble lytic murein transglycosylase-like protein
MTARPITGFLIAALTAFTSDPLPAQVRSRPAAPDALCEREMIRAAERHGLPVSVLYAVGLTETGRRESLQLFAMNIEGKAHFAASLAEALSAFAAAKARGARLIDIGCMQINHHYHGTRFESVAAMFDPARNVEYAAVFLKQLRQREGSWTLAVARYHAGPHNDPAQKRYVCAVIANMAASGFGAWTPNARRLCEPSRKPETSPPA